MGRTARALLSLILASSAAVALADDRVSFRFLPGHPLPGRSSERLDLRIERTGAAASAGDQDIDRFFASIETTLTRHRIVRDWQLVIPDAPSLEITIELDGRRIRLASAHVPVERNANAVVTERGIEMLGQRSRSEVLSRQGEAFRSHRLAFDAILELALDHARIRLAP